MITCKLGLAESEQDLPIKSRIIGANNRIVKKVESESANGTPHTQYITQKETFSIRYDIISEADKSILRNIEALQWQNNARLSYIHNTENGTLVTTRVRMTLNIAGDRILRDKYFEGAATIELIQC